MSETQTATDVPGAPASAGPWRRRWVILKRNKAAMIGGVLLLLYALAAAFAPIISPGDPSKPNLMKSLERPSLEYPLGTDELGRPILARIIHGSRVSLTIAVGVVLLGMAIGVPIGLVSGYFGGRVDFVIQRLTDMMLAFPGFLLALALVAILGVGVTNVVISVGVYMIPLYIRLVRAQAMAIRSEVYIEAAQAIGTRQIKILLKHVLPNAVVPIIVQTSLGMGMAILFAAGLGFLGVGVQPPMPEWGTMLGSGRAYIFNAPHVATFPGLAIFMVVLGFNLLGDGLRDALDPKANK